MFCKKCGKEIGEQDTFCPYCGAAQNEAGAANNVSAQGQAPQPQPPQYQQPYPPVYDSGSAGWGVLGFLIPIVGLILFLVWRSTKPRSSKAAGIGALISVILYVILVIIMIAVSGSVINEMYGMVTFLS